MSTVENPIVKDFEKNLTDLVKNVLEGRVVCGGVEGMEVFGHKVVFMFKDKTSIAFTVEEFNVVGT